MSAFEAFLAGAILLAAALQVVVLFLLYRVVAQLAQRTETLLTTIEPEISDLAVAVRAVRRAVEVSTTEIRATMAGVRATTEELSALAQTNGQEISHTVGKACAAAERQVVEIDCALDHARGSIERIGQDFDRTILDPARVILAVAMGFRRAIGALLSGRPQPVDSADESPDGGPA